jgi:hypothetical protein
MPLSHMKGADNVPICDKYALTIKEAVAYFNIGEKKLVLCQDWSYVKI